MAGRRRRRVRARLREHPARARRRAWLATLDPVADAALLYRVLVQYELPFEMRFGLNLAFYRTFAAPRIASLLTETGVMAHDPEKRAFDTGLIMYELIDHGFDHPRGRRMVHALNRMHGRWPIAQEDFRYVLSAFVVAPTRWADRWGWRPLRSAERTATATFYAELGDRMTIERVPGSYAEFADVFDTYDAGHLAPAEHGPELMRMTQSVIAEQLPVPLRPLGHRIAPAMTAAVIDERLARCLGLRPAGPAVRATAATVFGLRRTALRRVRPPTAPTFTPGMPVAAYPDGDTLEDLGVQPGDTGIGPRRRQR
jgi:hypothetical protein